MTSAPHSPVASALVEHHDPTGRVTPNLAAAILTIHRAPWEGAPDCPFIIELFTSPTHRRRGLARAALTHAHNAALASRAIAIALRVDADNIPAISLYRGLGFAPWSQPTKRPRVQSSPPAT
jgi:N-alpha-acetyltransferase 10/11